jgi:hypothetical protein
MTVLIMISTGCGIVDNKVSVVIKYHKPFSDHILTLRRSENPNSAISAPLREIKLTCRASRLRKYVHFGGCDQPILIGIALGDALIPKGVVR